MAATANHAAPRPEETSSSSSDAEESEMRDLEELLSKLNSIAKEFVPPSLSSPVTGAGGPDITPHLLGGPHINPSTSRAAREP